VGYAFSFGAAVPAWTVAWVTDLGYVPQLVREKLRHATHLVLEANYDCGMLDNSGRPPSLKQRIRGRHGHLSNDLALELLMTLENNCLRHVFFGHLSRECNSPELVSDAMMAVRSLRPKCTFTVLDPQADCPVSLEESP
jgi:phosphoribosyl 1,2-cyclic phosphodiesterase